MFVQHFCRLMKRRLKQGTTLYRSLSPCLFHKRQNNLLDGTFLEVECHVGNHNHTPFLLDAILEGAERIRHSLDIRRCGRNEKIYASSACRERDAENSRPLPLCKCSFFFHVGWRRRVWALTELRQFQIKLKGWGT